jgi:uncharacterized protein (DUF362 family)
MTEQKAGLERGPCHPRADLGTIVSRRLFLKGMAVAAANLLAVGCRTPFLAELPGSTSTPRPASAAATARFQVAISQAKSYDRNVLRPQVQALLDGLGGLDDVIGLGDRVAIKVNLTGGMHFTPPFGLSATESYLTHPQVVGALGELLRDAGARQLFIVEGIYDEASYGMFGYEEVAQALDATLMDLNDPHPYSGFASKPVGEGALIYEQFTFHPILEEVDAFVSVAKMKCHFECGVTHSMKNLVGLVPVRQYRLEGTHWWRSALHGQADEAKSRLPRVILDLNRARPIHLALIDGIKTAEGGEVPRGTFHPVQPGVLIAGKNAVATDAVATAAMGFDPRVEFPAPPFLRGDNYLNMAREVGLGTNCLEEIEVVGAPVDEVLYPFEPSREM